MKILPVLLVLVSYAAQAQVVNIKLGEGHEHTDRGGSAVAINRKNPVNIVAVTMQRRVYYTHDEGKSWQQAADMQDRAGAEPQVVSDRKGDFYCLYLPETPDGRHSEIICSTSGDGGASWEEKGTASAEDAKDMACPRVFIHPRSGELFLAWTRMDKAGSDAPEHKSHIMFSKSKDGKKWSDPERLNQLEGDCLYDDMTVQGASPAVTMDGLMFVVWAMNQKIYLDRSFNKGGMWLTNDIPVQDQYGGWSVDIAGIPYANGLPLLVVDNSPSRYNGSLNLVWADQRKGEGDTDVWYTRSVNYGDNWTSAMRVNDDAGSAHRFMPSMAIDQATGHIYIVYYDRRDHEDGQTDVYLAYSADNGTSFSNVKISESPFHTEGNSFAGAYTGIDAYRGTIVPVWTRMDDGKTTTYTAVIKHDDLVKILATDSGSE